MTETPSQDESTDYEVGYRKPPKSTRWQKGQSGNPRGRPKASRGLKADLHAELVSRMEIQMNGKRISGTKQQLMLKTLTARAAAGDVRAIKALIDLVMQVFGPEDRGGDTKRLSPQDQQILDELLGRKPANAPAFSASPDADPDDPPEPAAAPASPTKPEQETDRD